MSIGIPIKLLHESEHHIVTIEIKTGEQFMGYLVESEDTMNCRLDDVTMTNRNGKQVQMEQVYIRGQQIRFVVVPDAFKNAPMFKRMKAQIKGKSKQVMREKGRKLKDQVLANQKNKK